MIVFSYYPYGGRAGKQGWTGNIDRLLLAPPRPPAKQPGRAISSRMAQKLANASRDRMVLGLRFTRSRAQKAKEDGGGVGSVLHSDSSTRTS